MKKSTWTGIPTGCIHVPSCFTEARVLVHALRRGRIYRRQQGIRAAILSKRDLSQIRKFVRAVVYTSSSSMQADTPDTPDTPDEVSARSVGSISRKI